MKSPAIMIADAKGIMHPSVIEKLMRDGFTIIAPSGQSDVIPAFRRGKPDMVIVVSQQDDESDGLSTVGKLRENDKEIPIILTTRHSSEQRVIAALRAGASDYVKAPFTQNEILHRIRKNLALASRQAVEGPESESARGQTEQAVIGDSSSMRRVQEYLSKVAATDSTVLITGETGTGKELAAKMIHGTSTRKRHPFICINCPALPENLVESEIFGYDKGAFTGAVMAKPGKFELAEGGTLFLDEIGDMSHLTQAKILRTIERKESCRLGGREAVTVDVRLIAATNQDLERLVEEGEFRKDLYYRLNVARVELPPLRERNGDIRKLIGHFVSEYNRQFGRKIKGFSEDAMSFLLNHDWPGNIRELKNLVEASFVNLPSRKIDRMALPPQFENQMKKAGNQTPGEKKRLITTLLETNWNKSETAKKLNWSRMTVYRKMAKYQIADKPSQDENR